MNITENLIRIKEGKENIIQSLKNKGVSISDDALISEIPTIIDNAEIGGDTPVQPDIPELVPKYEGATVFRINVPEDNYEFAINLCNNASTATYDVDWGDGSLESGLTTNEQHHTYSKAGTYDVNIYNISKNITLGGMFEIVFNNNSNQRVQNIYLFNNTNNDYWGGRYFYQTDKNIVTNILIGDKITSIGSYAFFQCSSLQSIVISEGVTTINNSAFSGCYSLQSVVIPNSVTSISRNAFEYCYSLQSVVIPDSITSIGERLFDSCYSLQSVVIPDSITSIGSYAFFQCTSLQSVVIPNSVTTINNSAFQGCSSLQSVVIPEGVTSIKGSTFATCYSLQSVVIPEGVTTIDMYSFQNSSSLQSVVIPDSVTTINNSAFQGDICLQSITCNALTAPTIQSGSFQTSSFKYTKRYLYIPKDSVGYNEGNWKTYLIDKGWELRYIEDKPEKKPTTLKLKTKNNFFHNLQAIGQANLINYELVDNEYIYHFDDKITELISYIFYSTVLEEIELPDGLEIINSSVFYNSKYLHTITCLNPTAPTIQSNTFNNIGTQVPSGTPKVLRIPQGSSGYEETTSQWYIQLISKGYTVEYITE